jgi:hypothetical protein
LLLPFERILEIKRAYRYLFFSYLPYMGTMIFYILSYIYHYQLITSFFGLTGFIGIIQVVRLVSVCLMAGFVSTLFCLSSPVKVKSIIEFVYNWLVIHTLYRARSAFCIVRDALKSLM